MPLLPIRLSLLAALLGGSLLLFLAGCDEETLGPQTRGSIQGVVQDADTNAPIAQANVVGPHQ
jgi:hypothetical protein